MKQKPSENWEKIKKRKILDKISKLDDELLDNRIAVSSTADIGTNEDGWVVFIVSSEKKKVMKTIKEFIKEHKEKYIIR